MFTVKVSCQFDAAHFLRNYEGKCANLHGHTWTVVVYLKVSEVNQIGISVDFQEVRNALEPVIQQIDHHLLNDIEPFKTKENPSAENIARWIFRKLRPHLPDIHQVEVYESPTCSVLYNED